jgi:hypothetical protein
VTSEHHFDDFLHLSDHPRLVVLINNYSNKLPTVQPKFSALEDLKTV